MTAADLAGVEVTELPDGHTDWVQELITAVWGAQQRPQANLVTALSHAGTALLVARRGGDCVGVSLGFLGWGGGLHLHSHMTAVRPGLEGGGVGYALKLWQRCLCLEHDITEIRWTYDPLIARNAHFNLIKLGGRVRRFLPDHYGAMDDAVNAGDRSDRFEVAWQLDSSRVGQALARSLPPTPAGPMVVIPPDYDAKRRQDPQAARRVRERTRTAFAELIAQGLTPDWSGSGYVFHPDQDRDGAG